jgi:hypothetical protein
MAVLQRKPQSGSIMNRSRALTRASFTRTHGLRKRGRLSSFRRNNATCLPSTNFYQDPSVCLKRRNATVHPKESYRTSEGERRKIKTHPPKKFGEPTWFRTVENCSFLASLNICPRTPCMCDVAFRERMEKSRWSPSGKWWVPTCGQGLGRPGSDVRPKDLEPLGLSGKRGLKEAMITDLRSGSEMSGELLYIRACLEVQFKGLAANASCV